MRSTTPEQSSKSPSGNGSDADRRHVWLQHGPALDSLLRIVNGFGSRVRTGIPVWQSTPPSVLLPSSDAQARSLAHPRKGAAAELTGRAGAGATDADFGPARSTRSCDVYLAS
jgi:hypothetical protein